MYKKKHKHIDALFLKIDDIAPFTYYIARSKFSRKDELKQICQNNEKQFNTYINNHGKYQYIVKSDAGWNKLANRIILDILCIALLYSTFLCFRLRKYFLKFK